MWQDIEMHVPTSPKYFPYSVYESMTFFQITSRFQLQFINVLSYNLLILSPIILMILYIK